MVKIQAHTFLQPLTKNNKALINNKLRLIHK